MGRLYSPRGAPRAPGQPVLMRARGPTTPGDYRQQAAVSLVAHPRASIPAPAAGLLRASVGLVPPHRGTFDAW